MRLDAGLVFLSDSRTNAGIDQVSTFRKMRVYEKPGERVIVLMSAGNLSISQSVIQVLSEQAALHARNIWSATSMYEVAQLVGEAIKAVHQREGKTLEQFRVDFNTSLIVGGQIKGEPCRLFQLYSPGNFIESLHENSYFQIGEAKYGRPLLDRAITRHTQLDDAAKCALISMDFTLRANLSVGMPLDLLVYEADTLTVKRFVTIDEDNQYFRKIREIWTHKLKATFQEIDSPIWDAASAQDGRILVGCARASAPLRVKPPQDSLCATACEDALLQTMTQ